MIMAVDDLKLLVDCGNMTDGMIAARLEAIEAVIRAYTNNNFQCRAVRFDGSCSGVNIYGTPTHFKVGDTVQVSESGVDDGLYVVCEVTDDRITVDKALLDTEYALVTKVAYPADVVACAVDLYKWKQDMGDKVGIKSETLSRHTVSYEDSATLYMGYPTGILNGLKLHRKARC